MSVDLSNQIRSILKTFGLMAGKGAGHSFAIRVRELLKGRPSLAAIVDPLVAAWDAVRQQIAVLDRRLIRLAKGDPTCRLLMTCPGVGVIVSTSFAASIEAPEHFRRSRSVGAYLGLTPTRHQSGETDRTGGISRRGDRLMRTYLFEAAASLLIRVRQNSALKTWGRALAKRMGFKHAAAALARKLAVVLHAMWRSTTPFRPGRPSLVALILMEVYGIRRKAVRGVPAGTRAGLSRGGLCGWQAPDRALHMASPVSRRIVQRSAGPTAEQPWSGGGARPMQGLTSPSRSNNTHQRNQKLS